MELDNQVKLVSSENPFLQQFRVGAVSLPISRKRCFSQTDSYVQFSVLHTYTGHRLKMRRSTVPREAGSAYYPVIVAKKVSRHDFYLFL